ncbi:NAD(P)/FAD-dependent oxidoreductase [Dactylosporangium siamense]|uniref:Pyridine nucleotide-disulfide oxidoreductase n=1 Tax=Dactylosporangium siamense TaxID=685454 RepID=A0A919PRM9_9ACTN|nr:FAD-dependent oxidoreductase [Dactylosporangium siamense]GIG47088.1 pyridine nucleotide-disulfide oxidoreductase [Dactylosporangium siamense]
MAPAPPHHVVVGGSAAGVAAAFGLREHGFTGRVTLVDAGTDLPYERPPLSKPSGGHPAPRPIMPSSAYREQGIELRLGVAVRDLDTGTRTVTLDDGDRIAADAVLLATGVSPRRLDIPGRGLDNVLVLRDIDDARAWAARLAAAGPVVLLGGGFIGLEAAAVARRRGLPVTVVEATALPLGAALGPELARLVVQQHVAHGVRFHTGRHATALHGAGAVEQVELDDGTRLPAATVLVGCGVVPNDALARRAGADTGDGIRVDGHGRTSVPWVWAAGDVAAYFSPYTGRVQRIEHWDVASRHGRAVGASMAGVHTVSAEAPYFWSDQYDRRLQMFGRARPGDRMVLRPDAGPEHFLGFWVRDGCLVAAAGLDAARQLRAAKPLIERRIPVDPAALADPSVDLRSLVRAGTAAA